MCFLCEQVRVMMLALRSCTINALLLNLLHPSLRVMTSWNACGRPHKNLHIACDDEMCSSYWLQFILPTTCLIMKRRVMAKSTGKNLVFQTLHHFRFNSEDFFTFLWFCEEQKSQYLQRWPLLDISFWATSWLMAIHICLTRTPS